MKEMMTSTLLMIVSLALIILHYYPTAILQLVSTTRNTPQYSRNSPTKAQKPLPAHGSDRSHSITDSVLNSPTPIYLYQNNAAPTNPRSFSSPAASHQKPLPTIFQNHEIPSSSSSEYKSSSSHPLNYNINSKHEGPF